MLSHREGRTLRNRLYYLVVPLFYLGVAFSGSAFTARGIEVWYPALLKPSYMPPGSLIGVVWTVIYILTALSLVTWMSRSREDPLYVTTVWIYVLNGILNASWSYVFFVLHSPGPAVLVAALICLTVGMMVVFTWASSRLSSLLLMPYLLWSSFALWLNFSVFMLN